MIDILRELLIESKLLNPTKTINLDSHLLDDIGLDSLDIIEFIVAIESKFKIQISDEDIKNIYIIEDLIKMINTKLN